MLKQVKRIYKATTPQHQQVKRFFTTSLINHELNNKKITISIPNLSDSSPLQQEEFRLAKLHISEMDVIKKEQLIASFKSSSKQATVVDWKSQHNGIVVRLLHKEGQVVKSGQPFYELELSENQENEEDPFSKLTRLWNKLPPAAKYVIIFAIICESLVYIRLLFF